MNLALVGEYLPLVLRGLLTTLLLASLVLLLAMPLAFGVALCRHLQVPVLGTLGKWWVQTFRALPALVVLYFTFYGLPRLGLALQPFQAAALGMMLTSVAYVSEDFRASLAAIPRGQWDAAHALGLGRAADGAADHPAAGAAGDDPAGDDQRADHHQGHLDRLAGGVQELTGASIAAMSLTFSATDFLVLAAALYLGIAAVMVSAQAVAEAYAARRYGPSATVSRRRRLLMP